MRRAIVAGLMGMAALLLAAEAVLNLLPVSSATARNYYIDPLILTYPANHRWRVATGWDLRNAQTLQSNNLGFASEIDFVPNAKAVALVGDSFVESSMLPASQRPDAQLAAALANARPVYAFGEPGTALLDYAERIRYASQHLGVRDFVVMMEAGDVRQSLCGSGNIHGPCLDRQTLQPTRETVPGPSALKRVLSHSALAQYLAGQLKLDGKRLVQQLFAGEPPAPGAPAARQADATAQPPESLDAQARRNRMVATVADTFFTRIQPYATGRLVFVVDGRRSLQALNDPSAAADPLMRERQQFIEIARSRGAAVIDTETLFRQHWQRSTLSLNVGPYDAHFNALGIGLTMRAAAQALQ